MTLGAADGAYQADDGGDVFKGFCTGLSLVTVSGDATSLPTTTNNAETTIRRNKKNSMIDFMSVVAVKNDAKE